MLAISIGFSGGFLMSSSRNRWVWCLYLLCIDCSVLCNRERLSHAWYKSRRTETLDIIFVVVTKAFV